MHEQLRAAIEGKRLIALSYKGKRRIAEPHDYGVQNGVDRLFVYQLRSVWPASSDPSARGWRLLDVPQIEQCIVLSDTFRGSRARDGQNHMTWDVLYARVSP